MHPNLKIKGYLLIGSSRAAWTVDPLTEVIDELLPLVQEEEDEDGRDDEHDHQEEVKDFGDLLWTQPSFASVGALLAAAGKAAASPLSNQRTH